MARATLLILSLLSLTAIAADKAVDYHRDIKPILSERCFSCHGALKRKSGLRLDAASLIQAGGKTGPAVVAGKSSESLLYYAITGTNDAEIMPPEGSPLTKEQITLIAAWIDQGAKMPLDEPVPPDPNKHWSFQPPTQAAVPVVKNAKWVRNPIDAFVSREHEKKGLLPKGEASNEMLLRRVYLDLIGLPPTREQLNAFLKDTAPDAYEKVVDELLASPHYGERWGRHWMDVWRYSDWAGFGMEVRNSQPHIWRWRDWIIESVAEDKPYNQMIVEMLAGDELAPEDEKTVRATGFLARHYNKFNRNVWMDSAVEHTGKAFMGVTFNCARCHDHMFDPISQKEYYQLRAVFEPYKVRIDRVPGQRDTTKDGLTRAFDADHNAKTVLFHNGDEKSPDDKPLEPVMPKIFGGKAEISPVSLPVSVFAPDLRPFVLDEDRAALKAECVKAESELKKAEESLNIAKANFDKSKNVVVQTEIVSAAKKPDPLIYDNFDAAKPELWQRGAGQWEYKDGRLIQSQLGMAEHAITSNVQHPQDFSLRMKFKINSGTTYYSVGFHFDASQEHENSVYLSAHKPGPKAQISWRAGNSRSYPDTGACSLPIQVDREYVLRVDARGQLLNVFVDEKLVLAYVLARPRQAGKFALWTFDSTAEFLEFELNALPAEAKLAEAVSSKTPNTATTDPANALRLAEEAVPIAKAKLVVAQAELESFEARAAADLSKISVPPSSAEHIANLAKKAAEAQRAVILAKSEIDVLNAENAVAAATAKNDNGKKTEAEKKLANVKKAREDAHAAPEKPYTPIGGGILPATSTGRRLALARWISARQHPLTARVAVNHLWLRHFGEPLVPTVFDFGLHGKKPTHPELLDWLAVEFMDRGWSMKAMHRLMLTSSTYRMQSSSRDDNPEFRRVDPDNIYLWRANTRRMEGEVVRDSILHLSGQLDKTMGGPELDQAAGLTSRRRSVYFRHASEKQVLFLEIFDAANPTESYRRNESIVPQQALALANSPLSISQSRVLAAKLAKEAGAGTDAAAVSSFITLSFQHILCRVPNSAEMSACSEFIHSQTALFSDASSKHFDSKQENPVKPSADPLQRARENLVHVLFNHNDFVSIR